MAGNGNSGRPGLPASVHLLNGNRSKLSPAQLMNEIKDPAVPVGVPPMPDFLTGDAAAEWTRITEALLALGWVSRLDQMALATYCQAYGDWLRFQRLIAERNCATGPSRINSPRSSTGPSRRPGSPNRPHEAPH